MTEYLTTIGYRIGVPEKWLEYPYSARYIDLRHERIHCLQAKRLSTILWGFLWLCFPLPVVFAWCRTRFEKEGYEETIRATYEVYGKGGPSEWGILNPEFREQIISVFVTGAYGWMWPFRRSIEKWYDGVVYQIRLETGGSF